MRFAVLGPLEVDADGPIELDRPSHRRLLAILLLERGRPMDADTLIDRFWLEEPPRTARAALQTHISQLRRRLGADTLPSAGSRYRIELDDHLVDLDEFERIAALARQRAEAGALEDAADAADTGLRLWRGDPFPDLADDPQAQPVIAGLDELRLQLEELRASARLSVGQVERALPGLERIAAEHPFRERLWELLMRARTRLGRATEALDAYRQLRDALGEIGLEPSAAIRELEERIFREDPALVPPRVRNNLPAPVGSFVGRRVELDRLSFLLAGNRLVTLTGVGGTGKTRLAIEAGRTALDDHPDGVFLVNLASVTDPDLVVVELASALGLRTTRRQAVDEVLDALGQSSSLVIFDNCEHLLEACAKIIRGALEAARNVRILATSREALGIPGEVVYAIPPLAVPPPGSGAHAMEAYDSVRLFLDRATAADPSVSLDDASAGAIAAICRHLDGLPLALELAAARVRSMPLDRLAERLEDRVRALSIGRRGAPPRHRTLEAVIDWSYGLLDPGERELFEHLSVFAGGWTLEAASAVCRSPEPSRNDVEEIIGRLVDRSLVLRSGTGDGHRFRMLETIRAFARLRLGDAAELLRGRHRDWYAAVAAEAGAHFDASDQADWLGRIGVERDNMVAALDRSRRDAADDHIAVLAEALAWYRSKVGQYGASVANAQLALEHLDEAREPRRGAALRVRLAGTLYSIGDEAGAMAQAETAVQLLADDGPSAARVRALAELATLHLRVVQDRPAPAIDASEAAARDAQAIGDRFGESHALRTLGTSLAAAGEVGKGLHQLKRALVIAHEIEHPTAILGVYVRLYVTLIDVAQDEDAAAALADEALPWLEAGGDRWAGAASLYMWFGYGFIRRGDWSRAESMLERSATFHLEGMMRMSYFSLRAMLRWMQGRLDDARVELDLLRATDPKPRYFRLLFPIAAEVASEEGRLDEVRRVAEVHEGAELIEAERATPAATLRALVRAEVDAALAAPAAREAHEVEARGAMSRLRRLVERGPTQALAGLQLDRPDAYLTSAEAELTRLGQPDPEAWDALITASHFAYWRRYADWRRAEAELARDGTVDAARLRRAVQGAEASGADLIARRLRDLAEQCEFNVQRPPATGR